MSENKINRDIINDEICVAGQSIMVGFWNDTDKTNDVIINKSLTF